MHNEKVLVELIVPILDARYDVYFPINRRIGNVICLTNKILFEETNGLFVGNNNTLLYDGLSGEIYNMNQLVRETNIRNGSKVILL